MKIVNETFTYAVPEDCNDYITVNDYVKAAIQNTCPFYDGCEKFVPDLFESHIEEEII